MNFVVIGADHRMQNSECGFEALLRAFLNQRYLLPLEAIAEEYRERLGRSMAQDLAEERGLRWFNLDMTPGEKFKAGILENQFSRSISQENVATRMSSDELREEIWAKKLTNSCSGTTIVICGYFHFESLVKKLRQKGHVVDKRVYLETVPEIRHG